MCYSKSPHGDLLSQMKFLRVHEVYFESQEVGIVWEIALMCNFLNQLQQLFGICRSTFTFLVMCEQPLTTTPRGSDPFPEAPVWTVCVVKKQHNSKSQGSLVKKLLIPRHHQQNRNPLKVRETLFPWVQVEKANNGWPVNNYGNLFSLDRNLIQKAIKSLHKYIHIFKLGICQGFEIHS